MNQKLATLATRGKVLDYAQGDVQTLDAILKRTERSFVAAGLPFRNPVSNATFALRYFQKDLQGKRRMHQSVMFKTYRGGRIECLQAGYFDKAYYLDIHSAYPSEIAKLVRDDGRWDISDYVRADAQYAAVLCDVDIPDSLPVGPVPLVAREGFIYYPVGRFRTMVTLSEYRWLEQKGWVRKVYKVWQQFWGKGDFPFAKIADIYDQRIANPEASYALKIVMNSLYGKMAQRTKRRFLINRGWIHPACVYRDGAYYREEWVYKWHTSFAYASEITARIRLRLLDELPTSNVIFFATDGVMLTKPFTPENTGPGLGQWGEAEEVENLVVVGSGVYQYDQWKEGKKGYVRERITKFRGFSSAFGSFAYALQRAGNRHSCFFSVIRNTSMKQSTHEVDFNVLAEVSRRLDVNFDRKRLWPRRWSARDLLDHQYQSEPWLYQKPITITLGTRGRETK
jgi:hypothetical protein